MKNKKKIMAFLLLVVMATNSINVYAAYNSVGMNEIEQRETSVVWRYKMINGIQYRRLYDTVNRVWLTDWMPC